MPYLVNGQPVTDDRIRAEEARISRHPQWRDIADEIARTQRIRAEAEFSAIDVMLVEQIAASDPRPVDPAKIEHQLRIQKAMGNCRGAFDDAAYAGNAVPSHAIAFRTVDNTVVCYDANTETNFFGGGKLGMYTSWLNCTTYPNAASTLIPPQFEFYDYYPPGNNYGELGNDAFNSGWAWNTATAGVYLNSYNNIMAQELYRIDPKFQLGFNTAFTAYMNFLGALNGGGSNCAIEVGPPSAIPPP